MSSIIIDDAHLSSCESLEIVNRLGERRSITHVIHDIDGTHSLIRDWPPVMSRCMWYGMICGFPEDFDSEENLDKLATQIGEPLEEFDSVTRFFNGYSAITQLEYGIRRGIEENNIPPSLLTLSAPDHAANSAILERLRSGEERYPDIPERPEITAFLESVTPRLFRFYETLLFKASRDKNTEDARKNPEKWRVPGSIEFIHYLHQLGLTNYFLTGAVVYEGGGMREEVEVCGYEIGPGKMVETLEGSSWDKKLPKGEVMQRIFKDHQLDPRHVLIIGDGRTEIKAGAEMGCPTISRLPLDDTRQRQVHRDLGVNYIIPDYTDATLKQLIAASHT